MKKNLKWLVVGLMSIMILFIGRDTFAQESDPNGGVGIGFVNKIPDSTDESSTVTPPVLSSSSSSSSSSDSSSSSGSSTTPINSNNNKPNHNQGGVTPTNNGMTKYLPQTGEGRRNFALVGIGFIILVIVLVIIYYKNKSKGEKK